MSEQVTLPNLVQRVDGDQIREWCPHCDDLLTIMDVRSYRWVRSKEHLPREQACPSCKKIHVVTALPESPLPAECCEGVCDGIPHDDDCETPLWEEIDRLKRERDELRADLHQTLRSLGTVLDHRNCEYGNADGCEDCTSCNARSVAHRLLFDLRDTVMEAHNADA